MSLYALAAIVIVATLLVLLALIPVAGWKDWEQ